MNNATSTMPEVFSKSSSAQQGFGAVLKAEILRLHNKGATIILGILVLISEAIFLGLTTVSFSVIEGGFTQVAIANSAISLLYVVIGIYIVCSVSREHEDNTTLGTLMIVPNRSRLFAGRMVAWIVFALIAGLAGYIIALLAMFPFQEHISGEIVMSDLAEGISFSLFKLAFTAVICFSIGTIFRRVGFGLIVYLTLELIGGMIISSVAGMMPEDVANIFIEINKLLPNSLSSALTSHPTDAEGGILKPLIGMIAWMGVLGAGAFAIFKKVTR